MTNPLAAQGVVPIWLDAWTFDDGAQRASALFRETFSSEPDGVWAAPGRANVIGEHTDYNGGLCMPFALPHRTYVAVARRDDDVVRLASAQDRPDPKQGLRVWSAALPDIGPGKTTGWPAYAAGVLWALGVDEGIDAVVDSCVPFGSGLSSSAALQAAFAVAADEIFGNGFAESDEGRARLVSACMRAENEVAGAATGGMDQTASLRSVKDHAILFDCRDGSITPIPFDLERHALAMLVIDSKAPHQNADGQYAQRRATCERAAAMLGVETLREVSDLGDAIHTIEKTLPDDDARAEMVRRVRHVVTEIARTQKAASLMKSGRVNEIGPLLNATHASLRDDYEVSCPELDVVVDAATGAGAFGARMIGGGFGGSAIALVAQDQVSCVAEAIDQAMITKGFTRPEFLVATAAAPAGRVA